MEKEKIVKFHQNKIKSLDNETVSSLKKKLEKKENLNNSFVTTIPKFYNNIIKKKIRKESRKEIELLSNTNLRILKTLSTFVQEEMLNDSVETPIKNKNKISKFNSLDNPKKVKKISSKSKQSDKKSSKKTLFKKKSNISELSFNSHRIVNKHKLHKNLTLHKNHKSNIKSIYKNEFHHTKNSHKKRPIKNSVVHFSDKAISNHFFDKIQDDKLLNLINLSNKNLEINYEMRKEINYEEFMNEMEIVKINNNLRKDINFIKLKKEFSRIKHSYKGKVYKIQPKIDALQNNNTTSSKEINLLKEDNTNSSNKNLIIAKNSDNNIINNNKDNIYRILRRKNELFDSFDDEEYKEEIFEFYISPDNLYIKIFNGLVLFISISYSILVPFLLSKNYFYKNDEVILNIIFIFVDIIYIFDCIINLFIGYKNFDEHLIIRIKKIMRHYLKTWFVIDFLQAIPFFTIIVYNIFSLDFNLDYKFQILLLLKIIKLFKMLYYNMTISEFGVILSSIEILDDYSSFILSTFIIFVILNMTSCLFIFLGNNSHPSWILKLNMQDENYSVKYLTSIYFIIVTITTVGYGDITAISSSEIGFQIYLLIIGTIAYSFTISYISNQIVKINQRSMTFEKNMETINEIKLNHPYMKNTLYNEVVRNIYNMKLYERKDKHILLDSLPYSLKNKLIISMYQNIINNFMFFKNIDNSDFIVKVVTSFVPIISIKNDIVIQEGHYITEIIFVKKGVITLNINFDLNDLKYSLNKYFYKNQIGKFNIKCASNYSFKHKIKTITNSENINLNTSFSSKSSSNEKISNSNTNFIDMKIVEIRKNEHFGDALMFLNERSPLNAKIRTKTAELLMLRKLEAIEIYSLYPNIWKRINKISLHNMGQIYLKIKKSVIKFAKLHKINLDTTLYKDKSKINKINKIIFHNNEISNENNNLDENLINNDLNKNSKIFSENKEETHEEKTNDKDIEEKNYIININNINEEPTVPTLSLSKIKTYFQNNKKINEEKYLRTENDKVEKGNTSSIEPCISRIFDETINYNSNNSGILLNKLNTKKEKIIFNSFIDLSLNKQENFQINSSYENINKLSNYSYIKDPNLQLRIKNILHEGKYESNKSTINIRKTTFLNLPNAMININKNSSYNTLYFNGNIKSGDLTHKNSYSNLSQLISDNNNIKLSERTFGLNNNTNRSMNSQNPIIDNKSPKFNSVTKIISVSQRSNTPRTINNSQKKTNNKRASKINKQLNLITKNIENTSKNINNPEQFYSRFFKSIINKNSQKPNSNKDNAVPNIKSDNKSKTNTNLFRYYMKSRGDLSVKNSYRRKNIDE